MHEWRCLTNRHFWAWHGSLGREQAFCVRCSAPMTGWLRNLLRVLLGR